MNASLLRSRLKARGFTLAEFMVAITIGLIILAAVSSVYVSSGQTFRSNDNLARVQENMRIAFDILSRDVRQASFRGCAGQDGTFTNTLNSSSSLLWNFAVPVSGYYAKTVTAWNATPDSTITNPLAGVGRDILVVRTVNDGGGTVLTHALATDDLEVSAKSGISSGDILLVTNCSASTVFQATSVTATASKDTVAHGATASPAPGNSTNNLGSTFIGGDVYRVSTNIYYIASGASGNPALFVRKSSASEAEELVDGIEGMTITYGIDDGSNYSAARYVTAEDAETGGLWGKVVSVKIKLTAISPEDHVAVASQSQSVGNGTDKRLRQTLEMTISMRNRTG